MGRGLGPAWWRGGRWHSLALAAATCCLLLSGCTSDPDPGPAPPPPGPSWPVEIDSAAIGMSVTQQGVIVLTPGFTKFPPLAYRFDADGRRLARESVAGNPNGMALAPDGGVWVAATTHPDMASGTGVQVLDPVSLRVRREIGFPAIPFSVAFVGAEAWVGTATGIDILDARTFARKRSLPLRTQVYGLIPDPATGVMVVVEDKAVLAIDAETGRQVARHPVDAVGSIIAAAAGGAVWLGWPVDDGSTLLRRFDPRTLEPGASGPRLGVRGAALAGTRSALWVADHAGRLLCLDAVSGAVRTSRDLPNDAAVAADDRYVYVGGSHRVNRVNADC